MTEPQWTERTSVNRDDTRVERTIWVDHIKGVPAVCAQMVAATIGLTDATVDLNTEDDYEGCRALLVISGRRPHTPAEAQYRVDIDEWTRLQHRIVGQLPPPPQPPGAQP